MAYSHIMHSRLGARALGCPPFCFPRHVFLSSCRDAPLAGAEERSAQQHKRLCTEARERSAHPDVEPRCTLGGGDSLDWGFGNDTIQARCGSKAARRRAELWDAGRPTLPASAGGGPSLSGRDGARQGREEQPILLAIPDQGAPCRYMQRTCVALALQLQSIRSACVQERWAEASAQSACSCRRSS